MYFWALIKLRYSVRLASNFYIDRSRIEITFCNCYQDLTKQGGASQVYHMLKYNKMLAFCAGSHNTSTSLAKPMSQVTNM